MRGEKIKYTLKESSHFQTSKSATESAIKEERFLDKNQLWILKEVLKNEK